MHQVFVLVLFYSVGMYIRAWHTGHKLTVSGVTIATDSDLPRKSVYLGLWMSTDEQVCCKMCCMLALFD